MLFEVNDVLRPIRRESSEAVEENKLGYSKRPLRVRAFMKLRYKLWGEVLLDISSFELDFKGASFGNNLHSGQCLK